MTVENVLTTITWKTLATWWQLFYTCLRGRSFKTSSRENVFKVQDREVEAQTQCRECHNGTSWILKRAAKWKPMKVKSFKRKAVRKSTYKVSFIFLVLSGRSSETDLKQSEFTVCIAKLIAPSYSRSLAHKNMKKEIRWRRLKRQN